MIIEKPAGKTVPFRSLMTPEDKRKLEHLAKHYQVTQSEVCRQLIQAAHQSIFPPK